jgi:hypothetical protein
LNRNASISKSFLSKVQSILKQYRKWKIRWCSKSSDVDWKTSISSIHNIISKLFHDVRDLCIKNVI